MIMHSSYTYNYLYKHNYTRAHMSDAHGKPLSTHEWHGLAIQWRESVWLEVWGRLGTLPAR